MLLLMVQKSDSQPPFWMYQALTVNNGISTTQPQLVQTRRISEPSASRSLPWVLIWVSTPKYGKTPKSSILIGFFIINSPSILVFFNPYFWVFFQHPYVEPNKTTTNPNPNPTGSWSSALKPLGCIPRCRSCQKRRMKSNKTRQVVDKVW